MAEYHLRKKIILKLNRDPNIFLTKSCTFERNSIQVIYLSIQIKSVLNFDISQF